MLVPELGQPGENDAVVADEARRAQCEDIDADVRRHAAIAASW